MQWRNCGVIAYCNTKTAKSKNPLNRSDREDLRLAGIAGFEPTSDGVKVRCLTAWLYPSKTIL